MKQDTGLERLDTGYKIHDTGYNMVLDSLRKLWRASTSFTRTIRLFTLRACRDA